MGLENIVCLDVPGISLFGSSRDGIVCLGFPGMRPHFVFNEGAYAWLFF